MNNNHLYSRRTREDIMLRKMENARWEGREPPIGYLSVSWREWFLLFIIVLGLSFIFVM